MGKANMIDAILNGHKKIRSWAAHNGSNGNSMKSLKARTAIKTFGFLIMMTFGAFHLQAQQSLTIAGTPIYGVKENGDLMWFSHIGFQTGDFKWANNATGKRVGTGWTQSLSIFKGDPAGKDGVIYRVSSNGDLYWYKHYGYASGAFNWENGKKIGNGWQSRQVISGGGGILYSLQKDGTLVWQKHEDYHGGSAAWANQGAAKKVGQAVDNVLDPVTGRITNVGWNDARFIFSGGYGTVYMIDNKGDLYWNRHLGYQDGTDRWDTRKKIGNGWQSMREVFSGGGGTIYAVNSEGKLLWYGHTGVLNGANFWIKNRSSEIGSGWNLDFVF